MYKIENQWLRVEVSAVGAELKSIYDKEMEKETLWYGDQKIWGRQAPILFPNVGKNHEGHYLYKGKYYDTVQHGFARDMEFACIEETPDMLVFEIVDTEETRAYFPFAFVFRISYKLDGRKLEILWDVENRAQEVMYFTIGGHPGFNVPILENTGRSDYKLLFKGEKEFSYRLVYGQTGTADAGKTYPLSLKPCGAYQCCEIADDIFDKDALIFDDSQISWAGIAYPDGSPYITMECDGFTNFGIWSMPSGPYVCLEPWMGRCDDYGFQGEISEKPNVIALQPEDIFHKSYAVTVHKYNKKQ